MKQTIKSLLALLMLLVGSAGAWADQVTYIDEFGNERTCATATKITSTSTELSEGWYYVSGNVTINGNMACRYSDIHIILCDDAELKVTNTDGDGIAIGSQTENLTIYGQTFQTGKLTAEGDMAGIYVNSLTINGGIVSATATSPTYGVGCWSEQITINGGQVTAKGDIMDIYAGNGMIINGGQVTCDGGGIAVTNGFIQLGYTNGSDFIEARYYITAVKVATGKSFKYDDGTPDGGTLDGGITLSDDQKEDIAGKKLTPNAGIYTVSIADGITGGTVKVNKDKAFLGETVTVGLTPATGKIVASVYWQEKGSNDYNNITPANGATTCSFNMPSGNATIFATFADPVAEIDGTRYPSLDAALDAVGNNQTIKMLASTDETSSHDFSGTTLNFTIDLNGYTASYGNITSKYGDLTITDTSSGHNGTMTFGNITNQGNITFKDVTVNCAYIDNPDLDLEEQLTIDNATVTCSSADLTDPTYFSLQWMATRMVVKNNGSITFKNSIFLGNGRDPEDYPEDECFKLSIDETSEIVLVDCSVSSYNTNHLVNQLRQYVRPDITLGILNGNVSMTTEGVPETTILNIVFRQYNGLLLKNNLAYTKTVMFWDGGTTAPTAGTFDATQYPSDGTGSTIMVDNTDGQDRYIIVYIEPINDYWEGGYYWTDEQLLFSTGVSGSLGRKRAPGIDLSVEPLHLLKRDTYTDDEGEVRTCYDGTGWYYYKLPKERNTAAGYTMSGLDGFVPNRFDFYRSDDHKISMTGNVLTVRQDEDDPTVGWTAEITFDGDSRSYVFDAAEHKPVITGITVKKDNVVMVEANLADFTETEAFDRLLPVVSDCRIGKRPIKLTPSESSWFGFSLNTGDWGATCDDASFDIKMSLAVADETAPKGTETNPWLVRTPAEMNMFAKCVNVGEWSFENEHVKLMEDLNYAAADDATKADFLPVGLEDGYFSSVPPFKGTFNGNHKTISNLNYTHTRAMQYGTSVGLFGYVDSGTISDLTLKNCTFDAGEDGVGSSGAVAGYIVATTISNVAVTNCEVVGSKKWGYTQVGGIVGYMEGVNRNGDHFDSHITGCTVTGTTVKNVVTDGNGQVRSVTGGIAGDCYESELDHCTVENCTIISDFANAYNDMHELINRGNLVGGISGDGYSPNIHDNMVKGTTSVSDVLYCDRISAVGAIFGSHGGDTGEFPILYNNYYEKSVTVSYTTSKGTASEETTTLSGYTPRGMRQYIYDDAFNEIDAKIGDITELVETDYSDPPVVLNTYYDGAKMYVKPATIAGASTMTFDKTTVGTDCYAGSGATYYYAPGDRISVTVTCRQIVDDGRTFYEIPSMEMTDGTNSFAFYSNIPPDEFMYANATFPYNYILVDGMPDAGITITATIGRSDWFTIDTNQKPWMSFYHEWKDGTGAGANYTVTDAAANSTKTVKVKTVSSIDTQSAAVTTTDLEGVSYSGVPTLFNCVGNQSEVRNLPAKLRFDPVDGKTAPQNVDERFKGVATDTDLSGDNYNNVYVMNGIGDFVYAEDRSVNLAAHRCYIDLGSTAGVVPARLTIVEGDLASIDDVLRMKNEGSAGADWYTLDGRKLEGKPTKRGLYIYNGIKVVIK